MSSSPGFDVHPARGRRHAAPTAVIVTASMGGGHNAAADELARRLRARGSEVHTIEFLDAAPLRIGWLVQRLYRRVLRSAPWAYDVVYRLWYLFPFLWGPLVVFVCVLARRRLVRRVLELSPNVVVSTYPLSSLVLGRERGRDRLTVPVVTYLTDFSVHPLWVHPAVDYHLAVTTAAADTAEALAGAPALVVGPLVRPQFRSATVGREIIRKHLGLAEDDCVALVVAGSWGVGDVEQTVADIHAGGRFTTIAVCGTDESLRSRLARSGLGVAIGWTDEMENLMGASDVLVENAGGLTSLEALTAGLPIVTYRPIPGHGRDNAKAMAAIGATVLANSTDELHRAITDLTTEGPARDAALRRGATMAKGDPSAVVLQIARGNRPSNVVELRPPGAAVDRRAATGPPL